MTIRIATKVYLFKIKAIILKIKGVTTKRTYKRVTKLTPPKI